MHVRLLDLWRERRPGRGTSGTWWPRNDALRLVPLRERCLKMKEKKKKKKHGRWIDRNEWISNDASRSCTHNVSKDGFSLFLVMLRKGVNSNKIIEGVSLRYVSQSGRKREEKGGVERWSSWRNYRYKMRLWLYRVQRFSLWATVYDRDVTSRCCFKLRIFARLFVSFMSIGLIVGKRSCVIWLWRGFSSFVSSHRSISYNSRILLPVQIQRISFFFFVSLLSLLWTFITFYEFKSMIYDFKSQVGFNGPDTRYFTVI